MSANRLVALREAGRYLSGYRATPLPPQNTLWGWVRAALAFQPAGTQERHPPESVKTQSRVAAPQLGGPDESRSAIDRAAFEAVASLPHARRLGLRQNPILSAASPSAEIATALIECSRRFGMTDLHSATDVLRFVEIARRQATALEEELSRASTLGSRRIAEAHGMAGQLHLGLSRLDVDLRTAMDLSPSSGLRSAQVGEALDQMQRQAQALADSLGDRACQLLGIPFGSRKVDLALVYGALDDFTDADLSSVDLTGVVLDGVRWSEDGTRWPTDFDVERLKLDSQETAPQSGVFVVRFGTSTVGLTLA